MATTRIINRMHEMAQHPENAQGISRFRQAIAFLSAASPTARRVFARLSSAQKRINLFVHTAAAAPGRNWGNIWMPFEQVPDSDMPYQNYQGFTISTKVSCIRWWTFPWKEPGKRGCELGLLHELGHEVQWLIMGKEMREWKIWQPHQSHGIGTMWKKKGHAEGRRYAGFRAESDHFFRKVENWVVRNVETPAANEINAYHLAGRRRPNDRRRDDKVYVQHLEPTGPQYLSLFYLDPRWTDNVQDPALKKKFGWQLR